MIVSEARPQVTFIMAVLNGMPFITQTLASIAGQTYPAYRLIVWDNGSTDGTQSELQKWIPDRIAGELVLDRPLPLGCCRAALVERAQTELIATIDADDLNRPTRLERQVERILQRPDLVALGSVPDIIDHAERALADWNYPLDDAEIRWRTHWQSSLNASSVLFRRSAVLAAGNYHDVESEDLDLWMRLARQGRMENLKERLVLYRRHMTNLTAGVLDYFATERTVAVRNAATLFPRLDPIRAVELWETAYPRYNDAPVHPRFLELLRVCAVDSARAYGERDGYFTGTRYYALQKKFLTRNIVRAALGLKSPAMKRLHDFRMRYWWKI